MQRSLYSGVTGLRNHQTKLDVIGNNIANVNTVGFKSSRVRFQDVFSQVIRGATAPMAGRGGTNAAQVGMGMTIAAIDTLHTQGSPQYTGNPDDMAIQGKGYFVVTDGNGYYYTRDGAFSRGLDGDLVNAANGLKLLGWQADANGVIDTSGPLTTLNIPLGDNLISKATENIVFTGNLDANTPGAPGNTYQTEALVYDSQGRVYNLVFTFTKNAAPNSWSITAIQVQDADGNPVTSATVAIPGGSINIQFNADGHINLGSYPTDANRTITISNLPGGVANLVITLDLASLTQKASKSNARMETQDGFPVGVLEDYMVGSNGVISGIYSNGMVRDLGQIAIAAFANPAGLLKASGNVYTVSANSGEPNIGVAGEDGRGTIQTSALEMSNVDLTYEFTEMITTTRAYQANSRVITTSDELLQEVVNLKR